MKAKYKQKLKVTRKKVSQKWYNFSVGKAKILADDTIDFWDKKEEIKALLKETRTKISGDYGHYRGYKYADKTGSRYENFTYKERFETTNTFLDSYVAIKDYNEYELDNIIPDILSESGVSGVQVILKMKDTETGKIYYKSDFITSERLDTLAENEQTIIDMLTEKVDKYDNLEQVGVHIRVVYEKTKM